MGERERDGPFGFSENRYGYFSLQAFKSQTLFTFAHENGYLLLRFQFHFQMSVD